MKSKLKQRQARSAAAKKGWATRRSDDAVRQLAELAITNTALFDPEKTMAALFPGMTKPASSDPNPWPRIAAWIKARWAAVFG